MTLLLNARAQVPSYSAITPDYRLQGGARRPTEPQIENECLLVLWCPVEVNGYMALHNACFALHNKKASERGTSSKFRAES
jgi:hypothetical protein